MRLLHTARLTHLYLGVFISPAILFFALTGAIQTFSLHETTQGSSYQPPKWAMTLAQIHKKQTTVIPPKKQPPAGKQAANNAPAKPEEPTTPPTRLPNLNPRALPLKFFFLLVSLGLFTSTFTGLYMSWKYARNHRPAIVIVFLSGIVLPILLACI